MEDRIFFAEIEWWNEVIEDIEVSRMITSAPSYSAAVVKFENVFEKGAIQRFLHLEQVSSGAVAEIPDDWNMTDFVEKQIW